MRKLQVPYPPQATRPPAGETSPDAGTPVRSRTHLEGARLRQVRVTWFALTALSVVLFVVNLPAYIAAMHGLCRGDVCPSPQLTPAGAQVLAHVGISLDTYATVLTVDTLLMVAFFCAVGGMIAWSRSDDWLALLVAYMLIAIGTALVLTSLPVPNAALRFLNELVSFLGYAPALFFVFYLFPDGSFTPRWLGWAVLAVVGIEAGNNLAPGTPLDINYWVPNLENLCFFGILAALAGAQIYRYRRVYTPIEQQQSKWIIFSVALFAGCGLLVFVVGPLIAGPLIAFTDGFLNQSLMSVIGPLVFLNVFVVFFPLSFAIAILRYRLWDIDVIIRRTLIYTLLTGTLAAIYAICGILLQAGFETITKQGSALAIVGSTLAIAALFTPVRSRVQAIVDRRFYRSKYDAAKTLDAFSTTLHAQTDLPRLSDELVSVVRQTMQPMHLSLWLRPQYPQQPLATTPPLPPDQSAPPAVGSAAD